MATQQSGLVAGNKQNAAGGKTGQSRSRFPLSYSVFQTERFAEYVPFHVMEGVSGDVLPLHSNHEVQTYTLKSPILQSLAKKKDFFAVPMQAILPLNWEKFYTNPNIGEDVPTDCGLGVEGFWSKVKTLFVNSWTTLPVAASSGVTEAVILERWLKFFIFFENLYSTGCLMETLGISAHNWFRAIHNNGAGIIKNVTFDDIFDEFMSGIAGLLTLSARAIRFSIGATQYTIVNSPNVDYSTIGPNQVTLREALELMRDDLSFTVNSVSLGSGTPVATFVNEVKGQITLQLPDSDAALNLGRLWAYQLVCAHFYSNDHVDFIYSADLFRQYINQVVTGVGSSDPSMLFSRTFSVNGYQYLYDSLSAHYFDFVLSTFSSTSGIFGRSQNSVNIPTLNELYAYFVALFSFKRSLRFMDYFTGARSLPLAVGDHEVSVNANNKVDIIELSRSSMMTKFLQAVNRSGRKFSAYMQELFGKTPAYDYHNPMYLAHTSDLVGAPETDNTGEAQVTAQLAVTSRFRATASKYAFEFHPDRDCIVIGITYYDIPRVYSRATERQNFIIDRFDMFNPYLQFIGDQSISEAEIGTTTPDVSKPFAYTNRDMQYKQRYNQASGGFCVPSTGLDNWIFEADTLRRRLVHNISPTFIRSFNSELDRFYQRLTGYSLGTYFHFIVRYDNRMDASRPMAYNPTINV